MNLRHYLVNSWLMCYERRKTVWPSVEADLATLGIFPRRFISGSGSDPELTYDHVDRHKGELPERQRKNYAEAVIALVSRELTTCGGHLAVFEDDCATYRGSVELFEKVAEQAKEVPEDFDVFYLHCVRLNSLHQYVAPNILRLNNALGFRALILSPRAQKVVLTLGPNAGRGIDGQFEQQCSELKVFSSYPCVLRADKDHWSFQHEMEVKPLWLDMCVKEKGHPM